MQSGFARPRRAARAFLAALLASASAPAWAAELSISVTGAGAPLGDAVVTLRPLGATAPVKPAPAQMDQRGLAFVPRVLVVTVGSPVQFPNSDNVRHQVYSFSPAKRFELPLYSGREAKPVTFDKPGVIELGCNIHDWMLGYVVVVDTPYFAVTPADGRVKVRLPAGEYQWQAWHERQAAGKASRAGGVVRIGTQDAAQRIEIDVAPAPPPAQPADERLRRLQERFRGLKRDG